MDVPRVLGDIWKPFSDGLLFQFIFRNFCSGLRLVLADGEASGLQKSISVDLTDLGTHNESFGELVGDSISVFFVRP